MSEPTTYQLPPEPDGPVWDRHGDKWERTGDMLRVHGREWAEWKHVASGDLGTWPAPLMRGPVTNTEPEPAWPTAPLVWHDGEVWTLDNEGAYLGPGDYWEEYHMRNGLPSDIRDKARRFAREAVPVTIVPTEAWEAWLNALPDPANDADDDLVQAVDSLAQEVAR